jgi:hypothetical protein
VRAGYPSSSKILQQFLQHGKTSMIKGQDFQLTRSDNFHYLVVVCALC